MEIQLFRKTPFELEPDSQFKEFGLLKTGISLSALFFVNIFRSIEISGI